LTINSLGSVVIGLTGLWVAVRKFKIPLFIPSVEDIKFQLKGSWYEFISIISINLYTVSNIFILGLFAGNIPVGFFAGADKIRSAFQSMFSVFLQAAYPHISYLFGKSRKEGLLFSQKLLRLIVIPGSLLTLFLIIFADRIILLVLGKQYMNSIMPLRILSVLPLAIIISNILGIQVMLNLGFKKAFMKIVTIMGFVNLLISFILVPRFLEVGTSLSMAFVEIMVTLSMFMYLKKQGINLFKKYV
jgi:PST family polysaccharide transporter